MVAKYKTCARKKRIPRIPLSHCIACGGRVDLRSTMRGGFGGIPETRGAFRSSYNCRRTDGALAAFGQANFSGLARVVHNSDQSGGAGFTRRRHSQLEAVSAGPAATG